jgi:hypothetical protein
VNTAESDVRFVDRQPRHHLGIVNRVFYGLDRRFYVYNNAFSHPPGGCPADSYDFEFIAVVYLANHGADFRGAYIQRSEMSCYL